MKTPTHYLMAEILKQIFSKRRCAALCLALVLALPGCLIEKSPEPAPNPGGKPGNGEGYGVIVRNFVVKENGELTFSLAPDDATPPGAVYDLSSAPANGQVRLEGDSATYKPRKDYLGVDVFDYLVGGASKKVRVYMDVRPCFRIPVSRPMAENLHIVATVDPEDVNGKPTEVVVKKTDSPVTLVLSSVLDVTWKLVAEDGARIAKVVLQSHSGGSSVLQVPAGTEVVKRSGVPLAHNWRGNNGGVGREIMDFGLFIESLRDYFGANETSFQGCFQAERFQIPFTPQSLLSSCYDEIPSHYRFADQDCKNRCGSVSTGPAFTGWSAGSAYFALLISSDRLTATRLSNGGLWSDVRAEEAQSCGKYYYEISIDALGTNPENLDKIGVKRSSSSFAFTEATFPEPLYSGEVIGIALDIDSGKVKYSRDGNWLAGEGETLFQYIYEPVTPYAILSAGSRFKINFGKDGYRYPIPAGFQSSSLPPVSE